MIKITGDKEAIKKLEGYKKHSHEASRLAALDTADKIFEICEPFVPVDEGELVRSSTVQEIADTILLGYNKVYAARQHNSPDYNHPLKGQAFFLTEPVKRNEQQLIAFFNERFWYHLQTLSN